MWMTDIVRPSPKQTKPMSIILTVSLRVLRCGRGMRVVGESEDALSHEEGVGKQTVSKQSPKIC